MANGYKGRELFLRLAYFVAGSSISAIGASIFVLCATGTDTFGMLMQGVAKVTGLSNGLAHISINLTYLLIILIIDRKYIRIGTFAALFAIGPMIDFASMLLGGLISDAIPYFLRIIITIVSCGMLSFGLACVINASVGMGANDLVAVMLSDRLHLQFRWVRIGVDVATVIVGFMLGGLIGVGTIICAFAIGPTTQFFVPFTGRILNSLLLRLARAEE